MTDTNSEQKYGSDGLGGWEAIGIPEAEAQAWARAGYRPSEAVDWRGAGALDPGTAADWERYGFTPATAEQWLTVGEVGPADAITMSDAGMTPAECARIRGRDPRCVIVVTDEHGRARVQTDLPTIGFFVQIVMSALRAEPGGVARAVRGLVSAYIGSIVAILSIPLLDAAITQVCDGIVKTVTGEDLSGFGKTLAVAMGLSGFTGMALPVVLILVGMAIIISAVIIWAAMMIRKMLVVVAAIFAPLAFSGATADMTKNWMRRWIEVTLALLFSKLILVIIMTVGFMMMDGYGQHGGVTNTLTNVCIGVLLLALGGFAPLMALKMVHFAGEGLQHLHAQAAAARAQAQSVTAAPQKVQSIATRMGWTGGHAASRKPGGDGDEGAAGIAQQRNPLPTDKSGGGQATPPNSSGTNGRPASGAPLAGVEAVRHVANAPRHTARVDAAADRMTPPKAD